MQRDFSGLRNCAAPCLDLYSSRRYYRQLRTYHMGKVEQSEMVSSRNVAGMKLMTGCCDFSVDTDGYLDMQDLHDCRTSLTWI